MPRNGSGVYSLPAGSTFAPDTTIESAKVNAINSDLAADANTARPVTAGGTGGATVAAAKASLGFAYDSWRAFTTATGTANALTLTLSDAVPSLTTGVTISFTAASSNTTAATLNASALGAKAIRKISGGTDVALSAGDIAAAGRYTVTYDSAANSAAGAWIIVGAAAVAAASDTSSGVVELATTTETITGTDTSRAVTPNALAALWEKGSDVASASAISLGEGSLFHITGTTPITDIDFATPKDGRAATLIFDGALTLTHNSTTLVLPGEANITTAAGDRCLIVQDNNDNIYVVAYQRASGAPIIPPSTSGNVLTSNGTTWVSSAAAASGLGSGQSWATVTRTSGTSYQNTTGQPIMIALYMSSVKATDELQVSSDNATWFTIQDLNELGSGKYCLTVVPKNHYWRTNASGSGSSVIGATRQLS